MRRFLPIGLLAGAAVACSGNGSGPTDVPEPKPIPEVPTPITPGTYAGLITPTRPYPATYEQEAERRGRVVEVTYNTRDYVEGTAASGDLFNLQNMTFHEKNGARHEYRPMVEYIYNALPLVFPPRGVTATQWIPAP